MQLLLSRQQLKSRLLSSPAADKTSVEGRGFLKEISSVFLSLPDIRSETTAAASWDELGHVYFGAEKGYLQFMKVRKQRSVIVKEDGEWRADEREGVTMQRCDEKDRMYWRMGRWKKCIGVNWWRFTTHFEQLWDLNCTSKSEHWIATAPKHNRLLFSPRSLTEKAVSGLIYDLQYSHIQYNTTCYHMTRQGRVVSDTVL